MARVGRPLGRATASGGCPSIAGGRRVRQADCPAIADFTPYRAYLRATDVLPTRRVGPRGAGDSRVSSIPSTSEVSRMGVSSQ